MPVYAYKGLHAGNRSAKGVIDADSPRSARLKLRAEGIYPTELVAGRTRSSLSQLLSGLELPVLRRVPDLELALFSGQLATLLGAGVPLVESLSALTEQIENYRLKAIVSQLRESVNEGASLGEAMTDYPYAFDSLYRSLVRAGESSGSLETVLSQLSAYIESRLQLSNKMISAMIYPALMLGTSAVVLGFLLGSVIPTITGLLEDLDQPLPTITLVVIAISGFLTRWWPLLAGVSLGSFLVINRTIQTEWGRLYWDRMRLSLPVVGKVVRYVSISRFARTLGALLAGGVEIVHALEISRSVAANSVIGAAVVEAKEAITRGSSIAATLRQSGQFPPMVTHMVSVGEASGELSTMLAKISNTYDELVDHSLNRLTALMGPLLLIVVAMIVVAIILSTLLPLINLTAAI